MSLNLPLCFVWLFPFGLAGLDVLDKELTPSEVCTSLRLRAEDP